MDIPPPLEKFLKFIGISPTWLRWRLEEIERNRAEGRYKPRLPVWLRWMHYEHKFCPKCRGLVDREAKTCPMCDTPLPSSGAYRIARALGLLAPDDGAFMVSGVFLAVIVLVFGVSVIVGGPAALMRPPTDLLVRFGMLWSPRPELSQEVLQILRAQGVEIPHMLTRTPELWRWLGFGLMHIGIIHIVFNGMALSQLGPAIEADIGAKRMVVLITLCQLASAWAVTKSGVGAAGASGWLFGLNGFGISYYHRTRNRGLRDHYLQWALYGFFFGMMIGAHNHAHAGGAVAGLLLGFVIDISRARVSIAARLWDFLFYPCIAAWIATAGLLARSILTG